MADGFKEKFFNALGVDQGYDDDEVYDDQDYEYEDEVDEVQVDHPAARNSQPSQGGFATADVLVLDPISFDEAPNIVNKLKQDKTIVVNLKQAEFEEGRKIFDFLSGAVFALEGSLNRIAESVFILAPSRISVSTEIDRPKSSYSAQILNWEDE